MAWCGRAAVASLRAAEGLQTSVPLVWKSLSALTSTKEPVRMVMWASISSRARSTFSGIPVTSKTGSLSRLGVTM